MRGGVSSIRMPSVRVAPSARASTPLPRAVQQVRLFPASPSGQATSRFSTFANSGGFAGSNGVPGLGFDYPHLAAISGGLRNGRSSNFRRGNHRGQNSFVPILYGGYPYYDYGYGDLSGDSSDYGQPQPQQQPTQQPQVIVVQQPVPSTQLSGNDASAYPAPPPPAAAPVPDVGEFVLVRRDGQVLFASAFMVTGTQLTYVTPQGIRRTLPLADLDVDATQQMNEARGTTVQIHN